MACEPEPKPAARLDVVLCWHMHQPEYRDRVDGGFVLPWTYLHAIKDYVDMAAHLEAVPEARAVVNFAPVLLEQINLYAQALKDHLASGAALPDPLLATLATEGVPAARDAALPLLGACLKAHREHLIERYPGFRALADRARAVLDGQALPAELLGQITVWYHLAWLGESVRRDDARVQALLARETPFTDADRRQLLQIIGELVAGVLPRYRRLQDEGRVELSVTPWGHPILPLLLDVGCAREQMPDAPMPVDTAYPGGARRAAWHVEQGLAVFASVFGRHPAGCWPAEGAVSEPTVRLLGDAGFTWIATGGSVLRASLARAELDPDGPELRHRPWRLRGSGPACFFRDDDLSDRIGFTYSRWHGDDAAANLVHALDDLARAEGAGSGRVVSVILDGENAWEHYPYNGHYFLRAIYEQLARHPRLRLTTFADVLARQPACRDLPRLVAGSWVHGTLSTWIGSPAKNRAFELLCEAKRAFDGVMAEGRLSAEQRISAEQQLAICEGSDWAWWFADYNDAGVVADFDGLYRRHLVNLYRRIGVPPPAHLGHAFAHGGGTPEHGGTMRRATEAAGLG